jgi:hypothetical protein
MKDFLCIYQPPSGGTFRFHVNVDIDNIYAERADYWTNNFEQVVVKHPSEFKAWVEGESFQPKG